MGADKVITGFFIHKFCLEFWDCFCMLKLLLNMLLVISCAYACGPDSISKLSTSFGPSEPYHLSKSLIKNSIPSKQIDAELEVIIEEFRADLDSYNVDYDASQFNRLKIVSVVEELPQTHHQDAVAICRKIKKTNVNGIGPDSYSWLEIKIDRDHYNKYKSENSNKLKILLYHELGHCILDLHHLPNDEVGIMSLNIGKIKDPDNFSYYVDEMFIKVGESQE